MVKNWRGKRRDLERVPPTAKRFQFHKKTSWDTSFKRAKKLSGEETLAKKKGKKTQKKTKKKGDTPGGKKSRVVKEQHYLMEQH